MRTRLLSLLCALSLVAPGVLAITAAPAAARAVASASSAPAHAKVALAAVSESERDDAEAKKPIEKSTLWVMIGLLAAIAVGSLMSAKRRAKKILED